MFNLNLVKPALPSGLQRMTVGFMLNPNLVKAALPSGLDLWALMQQTSVLPDVISLREVPTAAAGPRPLGRVAAVDILHLPFGSPALSVLVRWAISCSRNWFLGCDANAAIRCGHQCFSEASMTAGLRSLRVEIPSTCR